MASQPPKPQYLARNISKTNTPAKPQPSRGQITAAGVLAEVDIALKRTNEHNNTYVEQLHTDYKNKLIQILPLLGVKNVRPQTLDQIAKDATALTLETIGTIQLKEQIPQVIADSLAQSVYTNVETSMQLRKNEADGSNIISSQIEDVATTHSSNLEKAAVLTNAATIADLADNDFTSSIIQTQTESYAQTEAPLAKETEKEAVRSSVKSYVEKYTKNLEEALSTSVNNGAIPNLEQYNELKDQAHSQAEFSLVQPSDTKINASAVAQKSATILSFKPLSVQTANELGLGTARASASTFINTQSATGISVGLALAFPEVQDQAFQTLLSHNQFKLTPTLNALSARQNELTAKIKSNKPLTYRERIEYKATQNQIRLLQRSRDFTFKKAGAAKTIRSYFGTKAGEASNVAWDNLRSQAGIVFLPIQTVRGLRNDISSTKEMFKLVRSPRTMIKNQLLIYKEGGRIIFTTPKLLMGDIAMARQMFGSLALVRGAKNIRNISNLKNTIMSGGWVKGIAGGMGVTPAGIASTFANKALKISAAAFGGLLYTFFSLGGAAFAGFLVGAAIGGTVGLITGVIIGAQVGAAIGTFLIPIPVVGTVIGGVVGGIIGGIIGALAGGALGGLALGLVAYGLSQGSVTATTAGVGVGAGAVTGGILGGILGSFLGPIGTAIGIFVGAWVGAAIGGIIGLLIGKAIAALGTALSGAALGAIIGFYLGGPLGALIGAGIGWLVSGGWSTISDYLSGGASAIGGGTAGFIGSILSSASGVMAAIWNGALSVGSNTLGFFGNIAGGLANGISALASGASTVAGYATLGTFGAIGITGVILSVSTGAAFVNTEKDSQVLISGDNQYFQITKAADKTTLQNPPPNQDVTFTITLTAKALKLTSIQITDEMSFQNKDTTTPITQDKNGQSISPITNCQNDLEPNQTCSYQFTITVNDSFKDSVIINTVRVTATPEGKETVSDSKTATVTVGNPPAACPRGWPNIGVITQAPEGGSHGTLEFEALDVAITIGSPVYATLEGKVARIDPSQGELNKIIDIQPLNCSGLYEVRFQHLSSISVSKDEIVHFGQEIGKTGNNCNSNNNPEGCGPHTHYQFNVQHDRSFKIEPPYIPTAIDRSCSSNTGCTPPGRITSAPL